MARSTEDLKATQVAYWNTRTRKRKVNQEKYTNKQIQELLKYYRESLRQLDRMVKEAYDKYSSDTGLGITELIGVLTGVERKEFLNKVKERMEILGLVPEDVYNQKMLSRITRVEALKEQAYWEMRRLQAIQEIKTTSILNNTMEHSYDLIMKDYVGDDYKPGVFTRFNPGLPEQVLREKWSGKNYSKRVWGKERNKMAKELPVKIAGALISGQSYNRTALEIRKEYNVMQWEAMRLVRTESAFVDGQSNKRAMLDVDITQYTLDVTLDSRTSDICGDIDETEVFNYEDAVVGENFQPFHPNCRTVDQPLTSEESIQNAKETFNQRLEELEEEEEEEGVNYEEIYPSGFDSAYDFLMSKQGANKVPNGEWARGDRGDFTLVMYETDSKVTLSAIGTREKGTGLGSELMEQLKEYIDFTHKLLVVEDVQNPKFFDKFDWLEAKESIKSYMYSPVPDDTRNRVKNNSPIVSKTSKVQLAKEVSPAKALSEYKDYKYSDINNYLRGRTDGVNVPEIEGYVKAIDSLFTKEGDIHTYRADGGGVLASILENEPDLRLKLKEFKGYDHNKYFNNMGKVKEAFDNLVGKEYLEKAYMSTSTSDRIIKKFSDGGDLSEWGVPAYLNISGKSKYIKMGEYMTDTEQEILLPRNTKLRIDSIRIEPVSREGYSGSRGEQFIAKINATIVK